MNLLLKALTLLELLVAIVLVSVIVLSLASIDVFSRLHVVTSSRRAEVQNEASYILEHITKNLQRTIGNELIYGDNTAVDIIEAVDGDERSRIKFFIDANQDGIRDDNDHWSAYRYFDGNISETSTKKKNSVQYCLRCRNKNCNNCIGGWQTLSLKADRVSGLSFYKPGGNTLSENYINVSISACWDPGGSNCGTPDNPAVLMNTTVKLPMVSVR